MAGRGRFFAVAGACRAVNWAARIRFARKHIGGIAIAALMSACAPNPVDVGSNDAYPGPPDATTPMPTTDWFDETSCITGKQLPILGTWEGYVENFFMNSGSSDIRMVVTYANDLRACGKVTLGNPTPPPPPTDASVGYPPGYPDAGSSLLPDFYTSMQRVEGFPMTMLGGSSSATRITFDTDWHELWRPWCALQTPISKPGMDEDIYSCLGGWSGGTTTEGCYSRNEEGELQRLDCGKYLLCLLRMCACTKAGCGVRPNPSLSFDIYFLAGLPSGRLTIGVGERPEVHNVFFTRKN